MGTPGFLKLNGIEPAPWSMHVRRKARAPRQVYEHPAQHRAKERTCRCRHGEFMVACIVGVHGFIGSGKFYLYWVVLMQVCFMDFAVSGFRGKREAMDHYRYHRLSPV